MAIQENLFKLSNGINHSAIEYMRKIIGLKCEIYKTTEKESIYTNMNQTYEVDKTPYIVDKFIISGLIYSSQLQFSNTNYTNLSDTDTFMILSPKQIDDVKLFSVVKVFYMNNTFTYKIQDISVYTMQDNKSTYAIARLDPVL